MRVINYQPSYPMAGSPYTSRAHSPQWYSRLCRRLSSCAGQGGWPCALRIGTCSCPPCARKCKVRHYRQYSMHPWGPNRGHPNHKCRPNCSLRRRYRVLSKLAAFSPRVYGPYIGSKYSQYIRSKCSNNNPPGPPRCRSYSPRCTSLARSLALVPPPTLPSELALVVALAAAAAAA